MGTFAEVEDLPIVYLDLPGVMKDKITRGDVTMIAGAGGSAKGQTCIWLATVLSQQGVPVILITPEDDIETTVGPRLTAAGANRALIHNMTTLDSGAKFLLHADGKTPGCIGALRAKVDETHAKCIIIDPILSCLGNGSIASNKGARALLAPLMDMAKETGVAIVLTHHTVLGSDGKPKAAGSKGLTDTLRLVYEAKQDQFNPAIRVLSTLKTNGKPTSDVQYILCEASNGFTYVQWLDNDTIALRRTAWRMEAEQAGKELGQQGTSEAVTIKGDPWSEDDTGDPDGGDDPDDPELVARVMAMKAREAAIAARFA